jgi:hypothetical protein
MQKPERYFASGGIVFQELDEPKLYSNWKVQGIVTVSVFSHRVPSLSGRFQVRAADKKPGRRKPGQMTPADGEKRN